MPRRDEPYSGPWAQSLVDCEVCGAEWRAVYPVPCSRLECASCGHFTRAPLLNDTRWDDFGVAILPAWMTREQQLFATNDLARRGWAG